MLFAVFFVFNRKGLLIEDEENGNYRSQKENTKKEEKKKEGRSKVVGGRE